MMRNKNTIDSKLERELTITRNELKSAQLHINVVWIMITIFLVEGIISFL